MRTPARVHLGPLNRLDLGTLALALARLEDADCDVRDDVEDPVEWRLLQARIVRTRSLIARVEAATARLDGRRAEQETDR